MQIIKQRDQLTPYSTRLRAEGAKIGFVPTMGALHQGHISLVEASKKRSNITIVSIFVNPTQFNDPKDLEKYPRPIEQDIAMLEAAGCDILYLPEPSDIYGPETRVTDTFDLGGLDLGLEGASRPGHFAGVAQVVKILLEITRPDVLFLGQKDYQQYMVIKKMIELTGLNTSVTVCPTLREADGLAMSSRNMRLNAEERKKAILISQTIQFVKQQIKPGYLEDIKDRAVNYLNAEGFKTDYVEIADAATLQLQEFWDGKMPLVILAAAYLNEVRLIDNMLH